MRGECSLVSQVITLAALARNILFDVNVYSSFFVNSFHTWERLAWDLSIELKLHGFRSTLTRWTELIRGCERCCRLRCRMGKTTRPVCTTTWMLVSSGTECIPPLDENGGTAYLAKSEEIQLYCIPFAWDVKRSTCRKSSTD